MKQLCLLFTMLIRSNLGFSAEYTMNTKPDSPKDASLVFLSVTDSTLYCVKPKKIDKNESGNNFLYLLEIQIFRSSTCTTKFRFDLFSRVSTTVNGIPLCITLPQDVGRVEFGYLGLSICSLGNPLQEFMTYETSVKVPDPTNTLKIVSTYGAYPIKSKNNQLFVGIGIGDICSLVLAPFMEEWANTVPSPYDSNMRFNLTWKHDYRDSDGMFKSHYYPLFDDDIHYDPGNVRIINSKGECLTHAVHDDRPWGGFTLVWQNCQSIRAQEFYVYLKGQNTVHILDTIGNRLVVKTDDPHAKPTLLGIEKYAKQVLIGSNFTADFTLESGTANLLRLLYANSSKTNPFCPLTYAFDSKHTIPLYPFLHLGKTDLTESKWSNYLYDISTSYFYDKNSQFCYTCMIKAMDATYVIISRLQYYGSIVPENVIKTHFMGATRPFSFDEFAVSFPDLSRKSAILILEGDNLSIEEKTAYITELLGLHAKQNMPNFHWKSSHSKFLNTSNRLQPDPSIEKIRESEIKRFAYQILTGEDGIYVIGVLYQQNQNNLGLSVNLVANTDNGTNVIPLDLITQVTKQEFIRLLKPVRKVSGLLRKLKTRSKEQKIIALVAITPINYRASKYTKKITFNKCDWHPDILGTRGSGEYLSPSVFLTCRNKTRRCSLF